MRVAEYFDTFAATIESALEGFRAGKPAFAGYSQIKAMLDAFDGVVHQVYRKSDSDASKQVEEMRLELGRVLHLFGEGDFLIPHLIAIVDWGDGKTTDRSMNRAKKSTREASNSRKCQLFFELEAAAGHFRGVAASLRARA
jgi:hypothetical protein